MNTWGEAECSLDTERSVWCLFGSLLVDQVDHVIIFLIRGSDTAALIVQGDVSYSCRP